MRTVQDGIIYVPHQMKEHVGYIGLYGQYYSLNGQVQPLLDGFYQIMIVDPVPFTDTYLNWLNGRNRHPQALANFYHKVGYEFFWVQKQNALQAKKYLNMGKQVAPNDPRILQDLAAVP